VVRIRGARAGLGRGDGWFEKKELIGGYEDKVRIRWFRVVVGFDLSLQIPRPVAFCRKFSILPEFSLYFGGPMLQPEQFETDTKLPTFLLPVLDLEICGLNIGPIEIPVSYDGNWRPLLHLEGFLPIVRIVEKNGLANSNVSIKLTENGDSAEINLTRLTYSSDQEKIKLEARLKQEPLVIRYTDLAVGFRAVLLSSPEFYNTPTILRDANSTEFEISFSKQSSSALRFISSNLRFTAESPLEPLQTLMDFLTFTKGGYCGLGNLAAYDVNKAIAFHLLGFTRNDSGEPKTNWFDIEIRGGLPGIFLMFSKAMTDCTTKRALRQAINFYRASNASREVSVEMSIIASHSGLEAIVNYILMTRAGWSEKLAENRSITFSDRLRAAAAYFGLHSDILAHSPTLSALSRSRNNIDEFEIISFIRNKLVHQDPKYLPTGIQLHEAWLVAQWLIEILVFGVIGYRGQIIDRRVYSGWRGTTCQIPFRS